MSMASPKSTLKTPSYMRLRWKIELINAFCIERDAMIKGLRRFIGTKPNIVDRKGYLYIYSMECINKNLSPRYNDNQNVKVRKKKAFGIPTTMLDLRKGRFVKNTDISLKNVRSIVNISNPLHGQIEEKPAIPDGILSNDEIKTPIQATDDVNLDGGSSLDQAFGGMQIYRMENSQNSPSLYSIATSVSSFSEREIVNSHSHLPTTQRQDSRQSKATRLKIHARYPEYSGQEERLDTFKHRNGQINWPHGISIQDTTHLARHGFFFTGRADLCRCYLCGLGLKDWSINDDVLLVHLKYSPNCKHLTETVDSQLLSVYRRNIQQTIEGSVHALTDPGTANIIKHPEYQEYTVRLASFQHWPPDLSQTPWMLAEAGFFHTGLRDVVRCYACDGGLQRWDAGDQPWIEHARWFPFCEHVKREKGEEYIRLVQAAADMPDDEEITQLEIPSDSPFPIYSPAATSVMALGYSKASVSLAIEECKTKNLSLRADNLTNVLLDKEEKGEILPTDSPRPESPTRPQFNEITKEGLLEENEYLRRRLLCLSCNKRECNILFLPCGHHIICVDCSDKVKQCPECSKTILQKVKTFMS